MSFGTSTAATSSAMSGIAIMSPTTSSMHVRWVTASRSRTNAMRPGGVRFRL
jgi:hypothetical protein